MRHRPLFSWLAASALTLSAGAAPPPQLVILEAVPNSQTGLLTVVGVNFGASAPTVVLAGQTLAVQSFSDSELVATLPALAPGTYLLQVSRGSGSVAQDSFTLTLGGGGAGGDIDSVAAGPGLLGGGASGDVSLEVDTGFLDGAYARLDADNTFLQDQQIRGWVLINDDGVPSRPTLQVETNDPDVFVLESWSYSTTGCNRAISANTHSPCSAAVVGGAFASTGGTGGHFESRGDGGVGLFGSHTHATGGGVGVYGEVLSPNAIAGHFTNLGGGRLVTGAGLAGGAFYIENDGTIRAPQFTDLAGNPIGGSGDVTAAFAGPGLQGGGDSGDLTLAVDPGYLDGLYLRTDGSNGGPFARLDLANDFFQYQHLYQGLNVDGLIPSTNNTIHAQSPDSTAFVIDALSLAGSGQTRAINGTTFSPGSAAVVGSAQPAVGGTGGSFDTYGADGVGVWAGAQATTGFGNALRAQIWSPDGIAGYFQNLGDGKILSGSNSTDEVFRVDGDGTVTAFDFISSSSLRYKTDVEPLAGALAAITSLRPVSFAWKATGVRDIGLIAEEVAQVVPEVIAFDRQGAQGIDYASLTALLIEAVQEQQQQIRELRQRLDDRR